MSPLVLHVSNFHGNLRVPGTLLVFLLFIFFLSAAAEIYSLPALSVFLETLIKLSLTIYLSLLVNHFF